MSGWPNRIARSSLGPTLVDKFPVVNPEHDVGAKQFNLDYWQLAGMNLTAPRVLLQVSANAGGAETQYQGIAWDPNGTLPKVTWTRTAQGIYTFSLPQAEYSDEEGNLAEVVIVGGQAIPQATFTGNMVLGQFELTGTRAGTVHMFVPQTLAKQDINFLCLLW